MRYSPFYKVFLEKRNFYYTIPVSKEKLLYDFYTIEMLNHFVKKRFDPNNMNRALAGFDEDDPEYVSLEEARKTLLPVLKNEMLDAMFVSSSCEIRHALSYIRDEITFKDSDYIETPLLKLTSEHRNIFESYEKYYLKLVEAGRSRRSPWAKRDEENSSTGDRYSPRNNTVVDNKLILNLRMQSIKAANRTAKEYGKPAVMRMFYSVFLLKGAWAPSFGGKPWADIAKCYEDLSGTTKSDLDRMTVYIDHAYDLQHNTGSVFNKLSTYLKDNSYSWITKALDYKYSANPWDLSAKSSGVLPRLSKIILARARVPKPSKEEISKSSTSVFASVSNVIANMNDEDFKQHVHDTILTKIPSKNIVNDKSYFESVAEKVPREVAKTIMSRALAITDKHSRKFIVETLAWTFPFKFYTIDCYIFQMMNGLKINGPAMGIVNAKDLVAAFYKEPNGIHENREALNSLETYVSDHIASFYVEKGSREEIQGDAKAVQDAIDFLTNLQKKDKISSRENSIASNVINSFRTNTPFGQFDSNQI